MKKSKEQIISECKKLSYKNYEKGYDCMVECWDDSDWDRLYEEHKGSIRKMKAEMKEHAELWNEQTSGFDNEEEYY